MTKFELAQHVYKKGGVCNFGGVECENCFRENFLDSCFPPRTFRESEQYLKVHSLKVMLEKLDF